MIHIWLIYLDDPINSCQRKVCECAMTFRAALNGMEIDSNNSGKCEHHPKSSSGSPGAPTCCRTNEGYRLYNANNLNCCEEGPNGFLQRSQC